VCEIGRRLHVRSVLEGAVRAAGERFRVSVTLTNVDTGQRRVVVTNDTGTYRAPLLPLGGYKIEYLLSGFAKHATSSPLPLHS